MLQYIFIQSKKYQIVSAHSKWSLKGLNEKVRFWSFFWPIHSSYSEGGPHGGDRERCLVLATTHKDNGTPCEMGDPECTFSLEQKVCPAHWFPCWPTVALKEAKKIVSLFLIFFPPFFLFFLSFFLFTHNMHWSKATGDNSFDKNDKQVWQTFDAQAIIYTGGCLPSINYYYRPSTGWLCSCVSHCLHIEAHASIFFFSRTTQSWSHFCSILGSTVSFHSYYCTTLGPAPVHLRSSRTSHRAQTQQ